MEQANNKITIEELIKDKRFKSLISAQIFAHLNRPDPAKNLRYKRTGMDELIDMIRVGNTDTIITDTLIALWVDVINKRSNLSRRLRDTLSIMFHQCIQQYFNKYVKDHGKEENGSESSDQE